MLDLTATNAGAPTSLTFATNSAAITGAMNDFVAALNIIVGQVNELAAPLGGSLGNDRARASCAVTWRASQAGS